MKTINTYIAIAICLITFSGMVAQNKNEEAASSNSEISNKRNVPELINYQAVARDASGALMANTSVNIDFEISDGARGTTVFNETQNLTTDANGVFSAQIGAVNSLEGVVRNNIEPWLHVSLNGKSVGETRIASVPYALHANYANKVLEGVESLNDLTDAKSNYTSVYLGRDAGLIDTVSDRSNTSVGVESLKENTTGNYNAALGYETLSLNTTGYFNTAAGARAMLGNTTGSCNVAIGNYALYYNNGSKNTASGNEAQYFNMTGSNNSAFGNEAMRNNNSGNWNTAIGNRALFSNGTSNYNTAIGAEALNTISSGGGYNIGIGAFAGYNITNGSNNIAIGTAAKIPNSSGSNQVRMGSPLVTYAGVQVGWSVTSDKRLKNNIETSNLGLSFINALKPVVYERINDESKKAEYGFIAQELEETLKQFGASNNGMITIDDEGMYSVRYNDLIAVLTKAVQEQQEVINNLKATLAEKVSEAKDFDARLKQLELKL